MKKKKYLVTGASGFIGSAIVNSLIEADQKVICIDNNSRGKKSRLSKFKKKINFYKIDIRDRAKIIKVSKGVDAIIHLAFINGTEFFYTKPDQVLDVGVKGMLNVIDACKINNIKEIFVASSSEVYQSPKIIPTPEEVELVVPNVFNPRYSYGAGKLISEVIAINNKKFFDRVVVFRPHNVYGPDMGSEHVIPQITNKILKKIKKNGKSKKLEIELIGNGKEIRAFNYIDDFCDAFMKILSKGSKLQIYNIGTNQETNIKTLANTIAKYFKVKLKLKLVDGHKGGTKKRCPNISKIQKLGYKPKISLKTGLSKTISWYLKN